MFLFNRSGLAVCLALVVAGLPVLIQFASRTGRIPLVFFYQKGCDPFTVGTGRPACAGSGSASSATIASTTSAAPALCAVPSQSGQPFQMRFIPIVICRPSAISNRGRGGPRRECLSAPPGAQHQQQHDERRQVSAEAVRVMDRDPRGRVQHAAFVVDAEPAPQHEPIPRNPFPATSSRGRLGKSAQAAAA